jgi:hypothetical protein
MWVSFLVIGLANTIATSLLISGLWSEESCSVTGESFDSLPLLLTASFRAAFSHTEWSHYINNLAMMGPPTMALNDIHTACVYLGAAIAGGLSFVVMLRCFYGHCWDVAKLSSTMGSSPSSYALCFFASCVLSPLDAIPGGSGSLFAMLIAPTFCSNRFGLNLLRSPIKWRTVLLFLALAFWFFFVVPLFVPSGVTASSWLMLYFCKIVVYGVLDYLAGRRPFGADNASHFGGSLLGLVSGILWTQRLPHLGVVASFAFVCALLGWDARRGV